MKVLFILPAAHCYGPQDRVLGWRHITADRAALRALRGLLPRLRELGAERVVGADLDDQTIMLLSRLLHIPAQFLTMRRFNWGKHHGWPIERAAELWKEMEKVWAEKPDVPIHSGDSRTSYAKRMAIARRSLARLKDKVVIVVAAPREIAALTGTPVRELERNHIYEWEMPDGTAKAEAVASAAV